MFLRNSVLLCVPLKWGVKESRAEVCTNTGTMQSWSEFHLRGTEMCPFRIWLCSFILAECGALGKQIAPASVKRPRVVLLWGQHHVTGNVSSSMGLFQSQMEQEGDAFHSCPLSNCAQTSRAGCCAERLKLCSTEDLKAGREYCKESSPGCIWLLHMCEHTCWLCSNSSGDMNMRA